MDHVYCKFAHNATLQAQADRIRIHYTESGALFEPGFIDFRLEPFDAILAAVNVREGVAHVYTSRSVYEVNGADPARASIRRIGPAIATKQQDPRGYRIRDVA